MQTDLEQNTGWTSQDVAYVGASHEENTKTSPVNNLT